MSSLVVSGANLYRSKLILSPADLASLDTTPILVAPAIPGKILMPLNCVGKLSAYTGSYVPDSGISFLCFGPTGTRRAYSPEIITQIFTGLSVDGSYNLAAGLLTDEGIYTSESLYLQRQSGTFNTGALWSVTVAAAGTGYGIGDTGEAFSNFGDVASYTVLTVGAGGAVLTASVSGGSGFVVGSTVTTSVTTGGGDGNLTFHVTGISESAGFLLEIDTIYQPVG